MSDLPDEGARLTALGSLVPGLAHDLGNAVTGILGTARLLGASMAGERERAQLERLGRDAEKARRLLDDVAALARGTARPGEGPATLERAVREALRFSSGALLAQGIDIVEEFVPSALGAAPLRATPPEATLLVLTALRLAARAIDAAGGPARISIVTGAGADGALRVSLAAVPGDASLAAAATVERATAEALARACGATLAVAPGEARGRSALEVSVAFRPASPAEGRLTAPAAAARALVVDDEPALAQVLADALRALGLAPEVVHDGLTGLERAVAGDFALVVSDLHMPGLDGERLCESLRARRPELLRRVILASGDSSLGGKRERFLELGVAIVEKPFRAAAFAEVVREVLSRV